MDNFIIKTNKKIKIEICVLGNSYTVSKVESWATAKVFILVSLNVHIKNMQWFFQSKIIAPLESTPSVYLWIHSRLGRWKTTKISQILKLLNSLQVIYFSWAVTLVLIVVYLLYPGLLAPAGHAALEGRVLLKILQAQVADPVRPNLDPVTPNPDPVRPNPDPKFVKKNLSE